MTIELSKEEQSALNTLKRLSRRWPERLWIFAGAGMFNVMAKNENGEVAMAGDKVDPAYVVWSTLDIKCDGGDW